MKTRPFGRSMESADNTKNDGNGQTDMTTSEYPSARPTPVKKKDKSSKRVEKEKIKRTRLLSLSAKKNLDKFECKHCGSFFTTRQACSRHTLNLHGGPETCSVCAKVFPNLSQLRSHVKRSERYGEDGHIKKNVAEVKQKPKDTSVCMYCLAVFPTRVELKAHQSLMKRVQDKEHNDSVKKDPVVCDLCNRLYKTRQAWKLHYMGCHVKKVACRYCNLGFQFEKGRDNHEKNTCPIKKKLDLKNNQPSNAEPRNDAPVKSVSPAQPVITVSELVISFSQLTIGHASDDAMGLNTRASRKRRLNDTGSAPFQTVSQTKKPFKGLVQNGPTLESVSEIVITRVQKLEKQLQMMSLDAQEQESRPIESQRSPSTIIESHLIDGIKELQLACEGDIDEVAHAITCDICGRHFTRKDSLLRHKRRKHVKEPVKCPQCGKLLANPEQLKSHVTAVHKRSYLCEHCSILCKSLNELKKHQFSKHSKK